MNMRFRLWLPFAALLATGCAGTGPAVRVDKAPDVDFTSYRTFGWIETKNKSGVSSLTDQRIQAAVTQALEAKGYVAATENPDMRLGYALAIHDRPKSSGPSVGVGMGGGSGGIGGGIGVTLPIGRKSEKEGSLTVDVMDAARKAQIWTGTVEGRFDPEEMNSDMAAKAVDQVLRQFPARSAAK